MYLNPTHTSEYYGGDEIGRYGIDTKTNQTMLVWYNEGFRDSQAWSMDVEAERKISNKVETILAVDMEEYAVYAIDREKFCQNIQIVDYRKQHVAHVADEWVECVSQSPSKVLGGSLWYESGRDTIKNHHKESRHA